MQELPAFAPSLAIWIVKSIQADVFMQPFIILFCSWTHDSALKQDLDEKGEGLQKG